MLSAERFLAQERGVKYTSLARKITSREIRRTGCRHAASGSKAKRAQVETSRELRIGISLSLSLSPTTAANV